MVRIIGQVMIVGRIDDESSNWLLVSIHDDFDEAVSACRDANDFVAPVTLHEPLPRELEVYYPHRPEDA